MNKMIKDGKEKTDLELQLLKLQQPQVLVPKIWQGEYRQRNHNSKWLPFMIDAGAYYITRNGHVSATDLSETEMVTGFSGQSQDLLFTKPQKVTVGHQSLTSFHCVMCVTACAVNKWKEKKTGECENIELKRAGPAMYSVITRWQIQLTGGTLVFQKVAGWAPCLLLW